MLAEDSSRTQEQGLAPVRNSDHLGAASVWVRRAGTVKTRGTALPSPHVICAAVDAFGEIVPGACDVVSLGTTKMNSYVTTQRVR